jgi:hypothetical protein
MVRFRQPPTQPYANSSNGTLDFSTTDPVGRRYRFLYWWCEADSTNPLLYVWSLYVGANGATGSTGATGAPGSNGIDAQYVSNWWTSI